MAEAARHPPVSDEASSLIVPKNASCNVLVHIEEVQHRLTALAVVSLATEVIESSQEAVKAPHRGVRGD
jgi:hypothetical protein